MNHALLAQMELLETFIKVLDRDIATAAESNAESTQPRSQHCLLTAEPSKIR
jgi:hypothetical protein